MIERILFVADFIIEHFKKNLDDLKIVQRNFSWPLVLRKMNEAQDNTLLQMLEQCFCSPYLSRYTIEEAYRMMFLIVEMVGSICYTSILLEQPAPIDQMKPVLFHTIRKILISHKKGSGSIPEPFFSEGRITWNNHSIFAAFVPETAGWTAADRQDFARQATR